MRRRLAVVSIALAGGLVVALGAATKAPPPPFDPAGCSSGKYELGISEPGDGNAAKTAELAVADTEGPIAANMRGRSVAFHRQRVETNVGGTEFRYVDDATGETVAAVLVQGSDSEGWQVARSVRCAG